MLLPLSKQNYACAMSAREHAAAAYMEGLIPGETELGLGVSGERGGQLVNFPLLKSL